MKKLLSIFAALGMTATASTAVVACGTSQSEKEVESYTGSKKTIDQTVEVKDNKFSFDLKFPEGFMFKVSANDEWNPLGTGEAYTDGANTSSKGKAITLIPSKYAKAGKDVTKIQPDEDEQFDAILSVNASDVKENCTITEGYARLDKAMDKKTKVTASFDKDSTPKIKNGQKVSLAVLNYNVIIKKDSDEPDLNFVVDTVLYNFTLKLTK